MAINANEEIAQKVIQMEHELLARGIPEQEVHRAVIAYFSQYEPPQALEWPGPVTGLDLGPTFSTIKVPDTGLPLTDFTGLPKDVQPYPTPNRPPYPMGGANQFQSNPTPDPNSLGNVSNTYDILHPPAPQSANWTGLASDVNSEPSMHGEHGFNVASTIATFPNDYEALHSDSQIRSKGIEPSGAITEAKKDETKRKLLEMLAKWTLLLGGVIGINTIVKNYLDSGTDKPLEILAEFKYHGHDNDDPCKPYNGKRFNLIETHNRPVVPSEKLGYTTTHPNCKCTWDVKPDSKLSVNKVTKSEQGEITQIENHITQAAKKGKLHKIKKDGKMSKKTTKKNPIKEICTLEIPTVHVRLTGKSLQEAVSDLRSEFAWLTDEYITSAKKLAEEAEGTLYLVRAAAESVTDHRSEGEPYRRKLSANELDAMTRTIIGKGMDINHNSDYETNAIILDAEFDKTRKEMQTLIIERDKEINSAIDNGKITAVSINGGTPRSESIEPCNHGCDDQSCELCVVPTGVVLGELDGIGMTWVITDPNGLYWDGNFIPKATPGIKITKIERV